MSDTIDLDAIIERERVATPGPWEWQDWSLDKGFNKYTLTAPPETRYGYGPDIMFPTLRNSLITDEDRDIRQEDRDFIAHTRTDIPALLVEVKRLTEENRGLTQTVSSFEAALRGEQGIEFEDGYLVNVAALIEENNRPVDLLLFCPNCGTQHIDAPDKRTPEWTNPPHRSHLCHDCATIWRPADVPTNGVAKINTKGKRDMSPRPWLKPRL